MANSYISLPTDQLELKRFYVVSVLDQYNYRRSERMFMNGYEACSFVGALFAYPNTKLVTLSDDSHNTLAELSKSVFSNGPGPYHRLLGIDPEKELIKYTIQNNDEHGQRYVDLGD